MKHLTVKLFLLSDNDKVGRPYCYCSCNVSVKLGFFFSLCVCVYVCLVELESVQSEQFSGSTVCKCERCDGGDHHKMRQI